MTGDSKLTGQVSYSIYIILSIKLSDHKDQAPFLFSQHPRKTQSVLPLIPVPVFLNTVPELRC